LFFPTEKRLYRQRTVSFDEVAVAVFIYEKRNLLNFSFC